MRTCAYTLQKPQSSRRGSLLTLCASPDQDSHWAHDCILIARQSRAGSTATGRKHAIISCNGWWALMAVAPVPALDFPGGQSAGKYDASIEVRHSHWQGGALRVHHLRASVVLLVPAGKHTCGSNCVRQGRKVVVACRCSCTLFAQWAIKLKSTESTLTGATMGSMHGLSMMRTMPGIAYVDSQQRMALFCKKEYTLCIMPGYTRRFNPYGSLTC